MAVSGGVPLDGARSSFGASIYATALNPTVTTENSSGFA
jgi:hypothetical protein